MTLSARFLLGSIAALIALRFVAAAVLPLSADEAYYWLWSRHLALGYYDHPPLIAYLIRTGTFLFGDSEFGVRVVCVLLSILASWFTYATARILLQSERFALLAALLFNLTLMMAVESMAATPDAPVLTAAAAFIYAMVKASETRDGRWWIFAGVAAGIGLLAKYTMFFLGAGALVWLLLAPQERPWLKTIWPYAGGILGLVIFAPNIWWNAQNEWLTFAFQFGRTSSTSGFNPKFLGEFIGAQAGLATPLILLAALMGLGRSLRLHGDSLFILAAVSLPSFAYFIWHGLHDRVQGNWPSFLYPVLAIAAALVFTTDWSGWRNALAKLCRYAAIPLAALLLLLVYAQAFFTLIPFGRGDPVARLLAFNMESVTEPLSDLRDANRASALLTSDYATTAWLSFYMRDVPVIPLGEADRWRFVPAQPFRENALYVTETRRDAQKRVLRDFGPSAKISELVRTRREVPITRYSVYRVGAPKAELILPRP